MYAQTLTHNHYSESITQILSVQKVNTQKPSRLEVYVEILKTIAQQPAKLGEIQTKTNIDRASIVHAIDFLEKQDLITKKIVKNEAVYENTSRGGLVTKFFTEQSQVARQGNIACGVTNP